MELIVLASSSAGNCYYIELERQDREPVKLLIEAGITYKEIVKTLALESKEIGAIDAVLITHGHNDHCVARKDLIKRGHKIYGNYLMANVKDHVLRHGESKYIAANTKVTAFSVEHDAEDPLGFVIQTDKETILFFPIPYLW